MTRYLARMELYPVEWFVMNDIDKEKQELAKRLRDELLKQKAEELGVECDDLMQRIHDGKVSYVKKSVVFEQLEKQRQLIAPKKVIRSLRDGQHSIVAKIRTEIQTCRQLLNDLEKNTAIASAKIGDYKTGLIKLENRTNSLANQLTDIENKVERLKTQASVSAKAEAVIAEIQSAKERNDPAAVQTLLGANRDCLKEYETFRKSLKPQIEFARKYRVSLQKEYWLILEFHYKIQSLTLIQRKKKFPETNAEIAATAMKEERSTDFAMLNKRLEQLNDHYRQIASHCPPTHIAQAEAMKTWDSIIPAMMSIVKQVDEISATLQSSLKKIRKPSTKEPVAADKKRMAYADRRKHDLDQD